MPKKDGEMRILLFITAVCAVIALWTLPTFAKSPIHSHTMVFDVGGHSFEVHDDRLIEIDQSLIDDPDVHLVAQVAWNEQRRPHTGGIIGMRATVQLIHNRVMSDRFPNTIKGVIYQKYAFSGVDLKTGKIGGIERIHQYRNSAKSMADALLIAMHFQTAVNNGQPLPYNYIDDSLLTYTPDAMCGHVKDRECLPADLIPDWNFDLLELVANIKGSLYFRYKN